MGWISPDLERRHCGALHKFQLHCLRPTWLGPVRCARARIFDSRFGFRCQAHSGSSAAESMRVGGATLWEGLAQLLASQRPPGLAGLVLVAPAPPTPQNIPEPAKQAQLHAYDNRENALEALAFLTAFPPSETIPDQILADNFASSPQAKHQGHPQLRAPDSDRSTSSTCRGHSGVCVCY